MGSGAFCIKVCDPAGPNAVHFCEHIYGFYNHIGLRPLLIQRTQQRAERRLRGMPQR